MIKYRKRRKGGFSLGELLLTVAILVILLAVAIPSLILLQRNLRQKELDSKAEIIYVAVQNSLSKLKAGGNTAVYEHLADESNGVKPYSGVPGDADAGVDNINDGDIYYITSEGGTTAAAKILAQDVVDEELRSKHWVVEYNPSSAIVYAVFYSEDRADCDQDYSSNPNGYDRLREKKNRLSDGARVGYYGGGSAKPSSNVKLLQPTMSIVNAEKLVANISCSMPDSTDYPVFQVVLKDGKGNTEKKYYAFWGDNLSDVASKLNTSIDKIDSRSMKQNGLVFNLELVLDDLSSAGTRFHSQYGSLDAGTELTVTVTAMRPGNHQYTQNLNASVTTNSLFADASTADTAAVSYGRHLQNLDSSSGIDASIKKAEQNSNITFTRKSPVTASKGYRDWYETYHEKYFNGLTGDMTKDLPNFKPIQNSNLESFDGKQFRIEKLTVEANTDAGLFETLGDGREVKNVRLTGSRVKSTGSDTAAGALVGKVTGNATIQNCQVFLTNSDYKGTDNHDVWIDGKTSGGLIGTVAGETVTIKQSSASTVVGGHTFDQENVEVTAYQSDSVGGLIGSVAANAKAAITESYADCYLFGKNVGGLVGKNGGQDNNHAVDMDSCYAAGFETFDEEGAGLVCGDADMDRSYTIMYPMYTYPTTDKPYYRTAKTGNATGNVFYLTASSTTQEKGGLNGSKEIQAMTLDKLKKGSDNVFSETGSVSPYNLMGQALDKYEYPLLKDVKQYGDWVSKFQPGALVYYEKYQDTYGGYSYGFYGANVDSTLKDDPELTVVGDGYGVVYRKDASNLHDNVTVTVKQVTVDNNGNATDGAPVTDSPENIKIKDGTAYPVTGADSTEYNIYPFSTDLVNTKTASAQFYLKAEVQSGDKKDIFYFNPHFARTVRQNAEKIPELDQVSIRTARHLYMLSLYYDNYADVTKGLTFDQERNIDYSSYHWNDKNDEQGFCPRESYRSQGPIAGEDISFQAVYDGNCNWITNVSFETEIGLYVGFIGRNNSDGTVKNVVLTATYDESRDDNYNVRRFGNISNNAAVYMGVLVGKNSGEIYNCSVAGYYIAGSDGTIHAYENSYLYGGGLVGGNDGTITRCSADTPDLRLSSTFARVAVGGFAGENSSYISDCYALGHIEVADAKGGGVSIAGFTGSNSGRIRSSYCATALTAVGEVTTAYGFAPVGGQVLDCQYLNHGTYAYVNHMYPFNFDPCAGDSATFAQMRKAGADAQARKNYNFGNTKTLTEQYPFRAVVRDADGNLVHYGDWLDDENMGAVGIFYWELEEGGSNNGYHFTYLGTEDGETMGGTTLCNAHDDGGVITEYGYGYFELSEGSVTSLTLEGAEINGQTSFSSTDPYNQAASEALREQMHKTMPDGTEMPYTFYAFTTRTAADNSQGSLCMKTGYKKPNCTWTLTCQDTSGQEQQYTYTVSPFFANAMRCENENQVTAFDGTVTDYSQVPGEGEKNQYEIRSVQQLQYINWNYVEGNTSTLVDGKHYEGQFTYLMYAKKTGKNKVSKKEDITDGQVMYWRQTHDLDGTDFKNYTPIAGNYESTYAKADGVYNVALYAWFGGSYNGESYKIQNVVITSNSYAVGLFGVTTGANMKNIIMYSDNDTVIERRATTDYPDKEGAYALGGLIGVAYDYDVSNTQNHIQNCAIAGYKIVDASTNQQGLGEANVGGLIGVANVHLTNCSAVTQIVIDARPKYSAGYGNCTRVGGLAGAAQTTVENCYSGGSAEITDAAKNNVVDFTGVSSNNFKSTRYYVGGLIGSGFTSNYWNFTNNNKVTDGKPSLKNCYTYFTFPEPIKPKGDTSYTAGDTKQLYCSTVGSLADRAHESSANNAHITFQNCYYLNTIQKSGVDLIFTHEPYYKEISGRVTGTPDSKTYTEMSDGEFDTTLGDAFSPVTTTEGSGNVPINGKYSFPGSNVALVGKNYPFPAMIQQKDLTFSSASNPKYVYVHYGDWPIDGPYWISGRDSMDIFADMQTEETDKYHGYAVKTFYLNPNGTDLETLTKESFTCTTPDIAEVVDVGAITEDGLYPVTIKAVNTGTTVIQLKNTTAEFALEVTANIKVTSNPESLRLAVDETENLVLSAVSHKDKAHLTTKEYQTNANTTWKVEVVEDGCENLVTIQDPTKEENNEENEEEDKEKNQWTVRRDGLGKLTLKATFTYDYPSAQDENKVQFTGLVYIDVLQPDTLGLSDGNQQYNVVYPGPDAKTTGENVTYTDSAKPQVEGADFFLYLDAEKLKMEELTIQSISGKGEVVTQEGDVYTTEDFHIEMDSPMAGIMYQYRSGSIYYLGDGEPVKDVTLTVVVNAGKTEGRDYTLTIKLPEVKKGVKATFRDGNETETHSFTKVLSVGTHKLPTQEEAIAAATAQSTEFTVPDGKMLAGWKVTSSEGETQDETIYKPGKVYDLTQNVTFTAEWIDAVNVTLDANGGKFQDGNDRKVIQVPKDETLLLSEYVPTRDGYLFKGWNTEQEGTGTAYEMGAEVQVDVIGENSILYAQWSPNLTLVHEYGTTEFTEVNGKRRLERYNKAAYTHPEGHTLIGWYTEPNENGTRVLDADGEVVDEPVPGYTEKQENGTTVLALTEDKNLYACWEKDIAKYVLTDQLVDGNNYLLVSTNDPNEPAETSMAFRQNSYTKRGENQKNQNNVSVKVIDSGLETYIEMDEDGYAVFKASKVNDSEGCYLENSLGYLNVDRNKNNGGENDQYSFGANPSTAWIYFGSTQSTQEYNQNVLIDKQSDWEKNDNKILTRRFTYTGRLYRKKDQWSPDGFTVKASKDTKDGANANVYIYEQRPNLVFSGASNTSATAASFYSAYSSCSEAEPAESVALTLVDGSRTVLTTIVTAGTALVNGYTAPERINSDWTLEGWYTAADGTGQKVLNADGTVVNNVTGYSGRSGLNLDGDTTLYACWIRQRDVFVRTDTLENDTDYMIVRGSSKEPYAVGQISGQKQFQQSVTIREPDSGSYFCCDTDTGAWSSLQDQYLDVCPDQMIWHYTEDIWDIGTFTCKATNGILQQNFLNTQADLSASYYRRTSVYEFSFAEEYFLLTLCTENDCTSQWVTVDDGIWCTKPKMENAELVGWFDSLDEKNAVQVLDGDGAFASDNVKGYVKDGKWIYDGGSLTLYAKWQATQESQAPQESTDELVNENPAEVPLTSVPEEKEAEESLPPESQDNGETDSGEEPDSIQPGASESLD